MKIEIIKVQLWLVQLKLVFFNYNDNDKFFTLDSFLPALTTNKENHTPNSLVRLVFKISLKYE